MMQKSLRWKLILAFVVVAIFTAALVALFIRITSVDRLTKLIVDQERSTFVDSLKTYYSTNNSWVGVEKEWSSIQMQSFPTPVNPTQSQSPPENHYFPPRDRRRMFGLADSQGFVIVPVDTHSQPGSKISSEISKAGTPIEVNGKQVGTLLTSDWQPGFNPAESLFLQRTNEALGLAMIGAIVVALILGILLTRTLIHPLQALTQAAQKIAEGELEQQVKVSSQDEVGQLALAFNRMSQEVARVNQQRRQMTADIAHDLRTPLTVIAGYIESMQDGVLQPTPQRLALIYAEIGRLQNMVEDLRMLSQFDAGELPMHPQLVAPLSLLERARTTFTHRAEQQQVSLVVEVTGKLPEIKLDESRMMQVFDNLLSNALRYTPPGGKIILSAHLNEEKIILTVQDNGSGITAEDLPYIFDRFHRTDKSRHTDTGESGLGLAIVKALVEAHGGTVEAESTPGVGTAIHLNLPV